MEELEPKKYTHSFDVFDSYVACENRRWGRFARRKVVPPRETSPAGKSEEKRLFSKANSYAEARKLNAGDFWETDPSGRYDLAVCFFFGPIPPPPGGGGGLFIESNKSSQSSQRTNQSSAPAVPYAFVTLVALSVGQKSNKIHSRD